MQFPVDFQDGCRIDWGLSRCWNLSPCLHVSMAAASVKSGCSHSHPSEHTGASHGLTLVKLCEISLKGFCDRVYVKHLHNAWVCAWSVAQLCVWLFVTHQASWSMGFSRQEYWSGLPFPPPGGPPDPGIKPMLPASQVDSLPRSPPGKPCIMPAL